ncbi:MAG: tRNA (adenosine(37)-N6)-threonylcarbamoyltransferase complex dimerization subunit type 1 TsaB [Bacilli bacterium]|nr:tRNA (adenosine(37)-N6)-threonylcarbamoyltransferase complex dimerization subunit type 1 TsaB [Bacilli bacterium]
MISLFIDTSLSFIRIGLFKDNKLIDYIDEFCDKDLSKLFAKQVRDIFKKNNLSINSIDKIYAVTGPGSFTGIRIGLTFAKVLGMSLKKEIIPVSELEVLASTNINTKFVIPLIDARREYVYTGMYDNDLNNVIDDKYILLSDFLNNINDNDITFVSYNDFNNLSVTRPDINYEKIIEKFNKRKGINYHLLTPNYLKDTEAEEKLKKKLNNAY